MSRIRTETCRRCGKGIYRNQRAIIAEILRRVTSEAPPLRWYRCPHDHRILHITSKPDRA